MSQSGWPHSQVVISMDSYDRLIPNEPEARGNKKKKNPTMIRVL